LLLNKLSANENSGHHFYWSLVYSWERRSQSSYRFLSVRSN